MSVVVVCVVIHKGQVSTGRRPDDFAMFRTHAHITTAQFDELPPTLISSLFNSLSR